MTNTTLKVEIKNKANISAKQLFSMYALREKTFYTRLGWKVNASEGYEVDGFDDLNPDYSLLEDTGEVVACTRLLKTTGNYMLKNIFPELGRGEAIPERDDVIEISRFAIDKDYDRSYSGVVSSTTYELFRSLYIYALEKKVKHFVIVTTTAAERVMNLMRLPIRRFGDGQSTMLGNTRSVALWLDINAKYSTAISH